MEIRSMNRANFDRHLQDLQDDLLVLGKLVETAIGRAIQALKDRDLEASEQVIKDDDLIDDKRYELEERCIELIATQQPLAGDLRILITVLH